MDEIMEILERHDKVTEFDEVVKTWIAVIDGESIRFEVHRHIMGRSTVEYDISAFIQKDVFMTPVYGPDGQQGTGELTEMTVWVEYEVPWVDASSAIDALRQELAFMPLARN